MGNSHHEQSPGRRDQCRRFLLMIGVLAAGFFLSAGLSSAHGRLRVAVSILPHADFVERLAGDLVEIEVVVGPGQSPHTYDPTSRQWARLSKATIYFATGVEMENLLLPRIRRSFPDIHVVDLTRGLPLQTMEGEPVPREAVDEEHAAATGHEAGHVHGDDCDHDHPYAALFGIELPGDDASGSAGDHVHIHGEDCNHPADSIDPHVWLSPRIAGVQAVIMADALIEADPRHAPLYKKNLEQLVIDLDSLDTELSATLTPLAGTSIFVFHPAFGYLASAYGMTQTAIERDGLDPGSRYLAEVIEKGRRQGVRAIFVSPQFSEASARMVAREIGAEVVVIDPLARDYMNNLRSMARTIRDSLED